MGRRLRVEWNESTRFGLLIPFLGFHLCSRESHDTVMWGEHGTCTCYDHSILSERSEQNSGRRWFDETPITVIN